MGTEAAEPRGGIVLVACLRALCQGRRGMPAWFQALPVNQSRSNPKPPLCLVLSCALLHLQMYLCQCNRTRPLDRRQGLPVKSAELWLGWHWPGHLEQARWSRQLDLWLVVATGAMTLMRLVTVAAAGDPHFRLTWNALKAEAAPSITEGLLRAWRQGLPLGLRQELLLPNVAQGCCLSSDAFGASGWG